MFIKNKICLPLCEELGNCRVKITSKRTSPDVPLYSCQLSRGEINYITDICNYRYMTSELTRPDIEQAGTFHGQRCASRSIKLSLNELNIQRMERLCDWKVLAHLNFDWVWAEQFSGYFFDVRYLRIYLNQMKYATTLSLMWRLLETWWAYKYKSQHVTNTDVVGDIIQVSLLRRFCVSLVTRR